MKKVVVLITLLMMVAVGAQAQSGKNAILRQWKTIDDETGKPRSVVEIYEKDGKVYGRILKLFREPGEEPDPICDECDEDDPRYNQRVIGMNIITDMEWDEDEQEYEDGEILDPANGSVYECEMWVDENTGNLRVRGYLYFLYRTQTWKPYDAS